jgi:hypothetical protein
MNTDPRALYTEHRRRHNLEIRPFYYVWCETRSSNDEGGSHLDQTSGLSRRTASQPGVVAALLVAGKNGLPGLAARGRS